MKILSPANSIEEAEAVFDAGADGIYIGGVTTVYSNYPQDKQAEWTIGENKLSLEEFGKLVDFCKFRGKYIQFEVYTDCLSESDKCDEDIIEYFKEYVKFAADAKVDSLLFDDIGAIIKAKPICEGVKINASFLLDTVNSYQVKLLEELNVNTVEISPQISIYEIEQIESKSSVKLAIISHLGCAAYEGACYMDHFLAKGEDLVPIGLSCKAVYKVHWNEEESSDLKIFDKTKSCSICQLQRMRKLNIDYLKTPGRHIDFNLILEWTKVYRFALDLLESEEDITKEQYKKNILKNFPKWRIWCRLNRNKGCLYEEIK